jgi:hypothetical protein
LIACVKKLPAGFIFRLAFFTMLVFLTTPGFAADSPGAAALAMPRITGTVYESDSDPKKILFNFLRTATNSGPRVLVECKFTRPDGTLACVEHIVYETNRLVSYHLDDLQANLGGDITIGADPKKPAVQKIFISYRRGADAKKSAGENLPPDTLIDDDVYAFILDHWEALLRGDSVKFRFVSLEWERTFGFRFMKAGETSQRGVPMVRIKMEPTSLVVSELIKPIYFIIEKNGAHRVAEYTGRTTPRVQKGKAWKYLDAETVYDWN